MIEVNGKYTNAKIMIDQVDENCMGQIIQMISHEAFTNPVRIMPDTHSGTGSVIGFTMTMGDKLIPNVVGVDISCFTEDTQIPLLNGIKFKIIDLVGKLFYVYSMDENLQIVPGLATAIKTKENSELYEIIISGGEIIRCSPDQGFMLSDGNYKQAKDLQLKDSLMPLYRSYDTRDGYECIHSIKQKATHTHVLVAKYFYGERPKEFVAHHKDNLWFNNNPDNLEYVHKNKHSSITATNRNYMATKDFKDKKIKRIKEKGFTYDPKFLDKKQEVARSNMSEYLKSNKFKEDVKDNGKRGAKYFREYNKIINNTIYFCELCGKPVKGKGGFTRHQNSCIKTKNHKVLSIKKLDYKKDVYCLQVEKYHNFAISAGVFVHNCGMLSWNVGKIDINHVELDQKIREVIPFGTNVNKKGKMRLDKDLGHICKRVGVDFDYVVASLGSLGSGNHFIELGRSLTTDDIWITVHSGSRNFGKKVCEYWQKRAGLKEFGDPKEAVQRIKSFSPKSQWDKRIKELYTKINQMKSSPLDFLIGKEKDGYLEDMKICQDYASSNRLIIMKDIMNILGTPEEKDEIESVHNYIDFKDNIIRKGAIRSYVGEKMIIPFNMRDGILICEGKSNPDWNFSAPHGAGRVYSRSKAKSELSLEKFENDMTGIFSTSVCMGTIDESPDAYKDSKIIEAAIEPTAKILDRIIPIHNMKDIEGKSWKEKRNGNKLEKNKG